MAPIGDVPPPDGARRVEQTTSRRTPDARKRTETSSTAAASDSVELSATAREATKLTEAAHEIPDVREDRVEQAKARMAAGEYDSENVRRTVADRLLDQFGI